MNQSSEVFDPFNYVEEDETDEVSVNFSDIFSASFDTSFDSSSFHFPSGQSPNTSAISHKSVKSQFSVWDNEFPIDSESEQKSISANEAIIPEEDPKIHLALHEEMVCLYNSISRASSCTLKGTISLVSSTPIQGNTFFLSIKDPRKHIENVSIDSESPLKVIKLTNEIKSRRQFRDRDYVFEVTNQTSSSPKDVKLLSYSCPRMLTPVPIVVQNKSRIASNLCRVSVHVRAVPSTENNLTNVTILMAVPQAVNGDTVRMSHQGGVWDPLKRLIVWSFENITAGTTLNLQSLFEFSKPVDEVLEEGQKSINFPVLVRCATLKGQLSNIVFEATDAHNSIGSIDTTLSRTFRVLYRKV